MWPSLDELLGRNVCAVTDELRLKLGSRAAWRKKWEWEESQDAGRVRHREHPQSKAGHKTQGVYFPFCQAGTLFFFYSVPESSRLIGGSSHRIAESWWQTCGLMLSPSLSLLHTYTCQNVSADTIQEEGEQMGERQAVSERGHKWWTKKPSNKQSVNLPHFHLLLRGVDTFLMSQHKPQRAAENLFFHSFNFSKGDVQLQTHLDFTLH